MAEGSPRPALRFTALRLERFLGLQRRDQALHFAAAEVSPGVTLIAGPNGSGKTTVARALEGLLWADSVTDPQAAVQACCELSGEAWTVELAGPSVCWQRAGVSARGPQYCPASERDRYRLSLHELLAADDSALAAVIRRELGGGYSLSEAAAQLGFSAYPPLPRKAAQRLRQAEAAVVVATREQAGLRRREAELSGLRGQAAAAQRAAAQLGAVSSLLQWREAGRALQGARWVLAQYDPRVSALRGKELEQFRDLRRRASLAQAACASALAELAQSAAALAARRQARPLPSPACLSRCRALIVQLQQVENDARQAQAAAAGSRAKEEAARAVLAPRFLPEQLARLDRLQPDAALAEAVRLASAAAIAQGVWEGFAALPLWAEPSAEVARLEAQRRGLDLLRAWLQEPAPATAPRAWARLPLGVALAGAGLALLLAVAVHWLLVVPAVCLGLVAWLIRARACAMPLSSRRADFEAGFARLGLALPAVWDADGVAQCHDDLAWRWSLGVGRREVAGQGAAARQLLEQRAGELQRALQGCRRDTAAGLGVALEDSPLAALHLVTRLAAWQAARDECVQSCQVAAATQQHAEALRGRLQAELAETGTPPPTDSVTAAATLEALEVELAAAAAEERRRDEQAQRVDSERQSVAVGAESLRTLLEAVSIRPEESADAEGLLARWTSERPAAAAAAQALQAAQALVAQCREQARRYGGAARELQSLRTPPLERCREDLGRVAAQRDALLREIESTETLVREAKRKHDLEQCLAERDAALAAVRSEREEGWRALAGQSCLEALAAGLELQASGVLRRAQDLFAQITRGRYRLLADESDAGAFFQARDTETDRLHDLATLSSGTRVQLLLAARLAFIAEKEGEGPLLPLVLDEVLGNSDEVRAGTIIDVVIEAARAGRQVFCFTAQQDEVCKWQTRLAQAQVPFAVCWLPRAAASPAVLSPALGRLETSAGSLYPKLS